MNFRQRHLVNLGCELGQFDELGKRIFLVSPDSGRCSNDHCAYNILQNKENTFITRITHVRINETYNQSVNNDFQSYGAKKSKYQSRTISKTASKSTEKTSFVFNLRTFHQSGIYFRTFADTKIFTDYMSVILGLIRVIAFLITWKKIIKTIDSYSTYEKCFNCIFCMLDTETNDYLNQCGQSKFTS